MRVIELDLKSANGPIAAFAKEALAEHPELPNPASLVTRVFGLRSLSTGATTKYDPAVYQAANILMYAAGGALGQKYGISGMAKLYGVNTDDMEEHSRTIVQIEPGRSASATWNNHGVCKNFEVGPDGKARFVGKTLTVDNPVIAIKLYDGKIDPQLRSIGQKNGPNCLSKSSIKKPRPSQPGFFLISLKTLIVLLGRSRSTHTVTHQVVHALLQLRCCIGIAT